MSEPKTAEVKVADLAKFMRTGSGKVALSREIIAEIERRAKSQKVKADGPSGEVRASLYSCPAATQSLLDDERVDLFEWICAESSDAIAAQAGEAFLGDWSICSASLMRDSYSARPYVLFYVEAEAKAAPASPPAETGEGANILDCATWVPLDDNGHAEVRVNGRRITTMPSYAGAEEVADRINQALVATAEMRSALSAQPVSPSEGDREPTAWLYTENRWKDGPRYRLSMKRQAIAPEDANEFEITEDALYTHPASDQSDTERMRAALEWAKDRLFWHQDLTGVDRMAAALAEKAAGK